MANTRETATKKSLQTAIAESLGLDTSGLAKQLRAVFLNFPVEPEYAATDELRSARRIELIQNSYAHLDVETIRAIQDYLISGGSAIKTSFWIGLHEAFGLPVEALEAPAVAEKKEKKSKLPLIAQAIIGFAKIVAASPEQSVAALESFTPADFKLHKLTTGAGLQRFNEALKAKIADPLADLAFEITALCNKVADTEIRTQDDVQSWVLQQWTDFEEACGPLNFDDQQTWLNIQHNVLQAYPDALRPAES